MDDTLKNNGSVRKEEINREESNPEKSCDEKIIKEIKEEGGF